MKTKSPARAEQAVSGGDSVPQAREACVEYPEATGPPAAAVSSALRQLPRGHDVPWHRVITASGKIAFDKGTPGFRKQRSLLMKEDVAVIAGRIDMQKYRWQPNLDELLWKPSTAWDE